MKNCPNLTLWINEMQLMASKWKSTGIHVASDQTVKALIWFYFKNCQREGGITPKNSFVYPSG